MKLDVFEGFFCLILPLIKLFELQGVRCCCRGWQRVFGKARVVLSVHGRHGKAVTLLNHWTLIIEQRNYYWLEADRNWEFTSSQYSSSCPKITSHITTKTKVCFLSGEKTKNSSIILKLMYSCRLYIMGKGGRRALRGLHFIHLYFYLSIYLNLIYFLYYIYLYNYLSLYLNVSLCLLLKA